MFRLQRAPEHPVLSPEAAPPWARGAVFNPAAVLDGRGKLHLFFRAVAPGYTPWPEKRGYRNYVSRIGHATSDDGIRFSIDPTPVLEPDAEDDRFGVEDPRLSKIETEDGPLWLMTYTALSKPAFSGQGDRVALALSRDLLRFEKVGVIVPGTNDKDAVVFPTLIQGQVALLHRIPPSIQLARLPSLQALIHPDPDFWRRHTRAPEQHTILQPRFEWEAAKVGAGPPPIPTKEGWLLLYHGVDRARVYRAGAALLALEDPSRVLARLPYPILAPEVEYERSGDIPNVVFPTGAVCKDGRLWVYYGAADKRIARAVASLEDLLAALREDGVRE